MYEYDYENRIVKITKDNNDIAEFSYDALGRRIKKRDSIADTNNIYYYNDNWQILCDYNDAGTPQSWFAYGNYIDEVLLMSKSFTSWSYARYYIHDHLYSPVALMGGLGSSPIERYEYDAYGKCYIMDASYNPRSSSSYGNPYYFTGREMDFLDGGNLKIQYNRNRYYDQYTGRWLTHDPLGYVEGLNLYEYVATNPIMRKDPLGTSVVDPWESYQQDCQDKCLKKKWTHSSQYMACTMCCSLMNEKTGTNPYLREIYTLGCLTGLKFDDYEEIIKTGKKIWEEREKEKERERKSRECPTPPTCETRSRINIPACLQCVGCQAVVGVFCMHVCDAAMPCARRGNCTEAEIRDYWSCVGKCFRAYAGGCRRYCDLCLGRGSSESGGATGHAETWTAKQTSVSIPRVSGLLMRPRLDCSR